MANVCLCGPIYVLGTPDVAMIFPKMVEKNHHHEAALHVFPQSQGLCKE